MLIFSSESPSLDSGRQHKQQQQQQQRKRLYKYRGSGPEFFFSRPIVEKRKPNKKKLQKKLVIADSNRKFLKSLGFRVLI